MRQQVFLFCLLGDKNGGWQLNLRNRLDDFGDIILLYPGDAWDFVFVNNAHVSYGSHLLSSAGPAMAQLMIISNLAGIDAVFQSGKNSGGGPHSDAWGGLPESQGYMETLLSRDLM